MGSKSELQSLGSVLVVGGCGFLGHHIVAKLVSLELPATSISVLDIVTKRNRLPTVSYHEGSITSSEDVHRVYQLVKPQIVIHTASPVVSSLNTSIYYRVNVEGTKMLLEHASQMGHTKAFVYTSSPSVIHDGTSDLVMADESYPVLRGVAQPEPYSRTKATAEDLVLAANRTNGRMTTCAIRPSSMFGIGDAQLLPNMLKTYYEGKTKFQIGDNTNLFDFTCVTNAAYAHILAASKLLESSLLSKPDNSVKVDGEAFIITNDHPYYFWDFTHAVWAAAGDKTKPEEIWVIPAWAGMLIAGLVEWLIWMVSFGSKEPSLNRYKIRYSTMTRTFCIDKAKARLGYSPIVAMSDGIKEGVQWFQENHSDTKKSR